LIHLPNPQFHFQKYLYALIPGKCQLRSSLLHAVSHDLRTPLAGIAGAAGTVLENDEILDPQSRRELLRGICEDAEWLIQVVENLLSITRIDDGRLRLNFREEMFEEIVAESIERMEKRLHGHTLETCVSDPTMVAVMDGRLIEQVLINLIDNAVRYTPEGTVIRVKAWSGGDRVYFEVLDNGPGLNEKDIPYLFDRFFTRGESRFDTRKGIGLGLSISKSIVNAHSGGIIAENIIPKGAAFRFWLPVRQTGESS
jgi:two-component system sensor histidine kinase KdpD